MIENVAGLQCPWCGEVYDRFVKHCELYDDDIPRNACESGLGFWIHDEDE